MRPKILLDNLTILITGFKYQFKTQKKTIKINLSIYQKNYIIHKKKKNLAFLFVDLMMIPSGLNSFAKKK